MVGDLFCMPVAVRGRESVVGGVVASGIAMMIQGDVKR